MNQGIKLFRSAVILMLALIFIAQPLMASAASIPPTKIVDNKGSLASLVKKATSGYGQPSIPDPIVQDISTRNGSVAWVEVFRGDASLNHSVDFPDFGQIGTYYNKLATGFLEPKDPNRSGVVDFPDFGYIGANYNQQIKGWSLIVDSQEKARFSLNDVRLTKTVSTRGWWQWAISRSAITDLTPVGATSVVIAPVDGQGIAWPQLGANVSGLLPARK